MQIASQVRNAELIVIYRQNLANAVEINGPILAFDFIPGVGQRNHNFIARCPIGPQLGTINSIFAGSVIQYFIVNF
ncbi:Uncharacterised protein [Yersinia massiliensis]|nr:Uncharacterised protein [Yersinia massiliensis]